MGRGVMAIEAIMARRNAPGRVEILDATGSLVRQWTSESQSEASLHLTWDGTDGRGTPVPTGAYFLRLRAAEGDAVATTIVVR
jgi:flagellar hook assembly protein FlgD